MATEIKTTGTAALRDALKSARPGSVEHRAIRTELAERVTALKERIDTRSDYIRQAMQSNARDAEEYHRGVRERLSADLDTALGF